MSQVLKSAEVIIKFFLENVKIPSVFIKRSQWCVNDLHPIPQFITKSVMRLIKSNESLEFRKRNEIKRRLVKFRENQQKFISPA